MGTLKQAMKILSIFEDTPTKQVQVILESGFLADLRDFNIAEIDRDEFRRLGSLKPLNPPLLEVIGTAAIPATEKFVARKRFTTNNPEVKIGYISDNFYDWFCNKTEGPNAEATLRYATLTKVSLNKPILDELGNSAETTLAQVYELMKCQPNGEPGVLFTNGYANIFYVRDTNGTLRAVGVRWYARSGGWGVGAHSVSDPDGWDDDSRVFSRNFC